MTIIKVRRHTASVWTATNPILADGEQGLETDTRKTKFGNGTTAWNALGYANPAPSTGGTGLPVGGTAAQVLTKASSTDGDANWQTPTIPAPVSSLPTGGTAAQVLTKRTNASGDVDWETPAAVSTAVLPAGGTARQVLAKNSTTDRDAGWITPAAADLSFIPNGSISSATVQLAIQEVRDEAASGVSGATTIAGIPVNGCIFGAAVGAHPGTQTTTAYIANTLTLEGKYGSTFGGHRLYVPPEGFFQPSVRAAELADDAAKNRTSVLSLRTPYVPPYTAGGSNTYYTWAQMATDPIIPGRSIGCLTEAAQQIGAYSHPIVIVAHHEPDLTGGLSGTGFSPTDYSNFQQAFFTKIRLFAPRVTTAVCFVGYKLYNGTMSTATVRSYLPTDLSLVDMIATDPYNTKTTSGMGADTYQALVTPWLNYAATINKPYGSMEMGIRLVTGAREQWWTDAGTFISNNPRIKMALAWSDSDVGSTRDYFIDDTTTLMTAIQNATASAYFHPVIGGAGGSVAWVDYGQGQKTGGVTIPVNASDVTVASLRDGLIPSKIIGGDSGGNTYTMKIADAGYVIETFNSALLTIVIPPNVFPVNAGFEIMQLSGPLVIQAGSGVTLQSFNNTVNGAGQFGSIFCRQRQLNVWHLSGDLA